MLRTAIQKKITDAIEAGTFYEITYSGRTPTTTANKKTPSSVVVNEISGVPSRSVRFGARDGNMSLSDWLFEARVKFDVEVETDTFLTTELRSVYFTHNKEVRVVATPSFQAAEPPRQGSHSGTEIVINFIINTRR